MGRCTEIGYDRFRQGQQGLTPGPTAAEIAAGYFLRSDGVWAAHPVLGTYPEAANFAALPAAADNIGTIYAVLAPQGTWFVNRKPAGYYRSDGAEWVYLGDLADPYFNDGYLTFSDDVDPTKKLQFQLSGIATGNTRVLTIPNMSGEIALVESLAAAAFTGSYLDLLDTPVLGTAAAADAADFAASGAIGGSGLTMATARLLGRTTAGTGAPEELTAGTSLSLTAGSLNTIQGIRTTDTPTFGGLTLQGAGNRDLFVTSTEPVTGRSFRIRAGSDGVFSVTDATAGTQRLAISASGDVGIGAAPASGTRLLVEGPGGSTANLIIRGDGEQTYRLYNTAAAGTTRVSWKMANRLDPDWTWIWYTDSADNGTDDLTLQNRSGIVARVNAAGRMTLNQGLQVNGSIFLGTDANQIVNAATGNLQLYSGMIFDGVNNVARATTASRLALVNGTVELATNSGLTIGNPFTPSTRLSISTAGAVRLHNYGAGLIQSDASGNLTSVTAINPTSIGATTPGTGAFTTLTTTGNITLPNAFFLSARNAANTLAIPLIGRNAADRVSIDPDGYGVVIAGNLGIGETTVEAGNRLALRSDINTSYSASSYQDLNRLRLHNAANATGITNLIRFSGGGGSHEAFFGTVQDASGYADFVWKTFAGSYGERMRMSAAGALRLNNYGAGTLTTDSSGNVTATSDARAKDTVAPFTTGLAAIRKLVPKAFRWKPETGLNTGDLNVGLYAQDLIAAGLAEAVATERTVEVYDEVEVEVEDVERIEREVLSEDPKLPPIRVVDEKPVTRVERRVRLDANGKPVTERVPAPYTVNDRTVIAALVNAVRELADQVDALRGRAPSPAPIL